MASSLEYLLNRYANKTCTPEEKEELMRLLQESGNDEAVQQLIEKMIQERPVKHQMPETTAQAILQSIFEADETPVVTMATTQVRRLAFGRIAAAAVILLLLTTAGWLWLTNTTKTQLATTVNVKNDVAPGGNKALLTLANGATIVLDNEENGIVAREGNANVVKLKNGQLKYEKAAGQGSTASDDGKPAMAYNTLSTPKGGEYRIVLPDGSKVWLNAASSITYPTAFDAKERKVQVTGEAYFEVAKLVTAKDGKRIPFLVDIRSARGHLGQVQVLGTHFNINAYDDEEAVKTTLLEGKVKIVKATTTTNEATAKNNKAQAEGASAVLSPGEQATIGGGRSNKLATDGVQVKHVDVNDVMAWKNGMFHFERADIQTVMRQLSRWYDVQVVYKKDLDKSDPLFFEVSRHTNLSDVLKVLNLAGGARFTIEDKKIIVQ
ncbi:FecR family protein [Longitalea luteola]|uniref:FecR family protein n=1 Tax=Longitalea luteola TaxID=2812563 RepID=UPI001A9689BE|nr:FecR family protein [Longitalea luteola]